MEEIDYLWNIFILGLLFYQAVYDFKYRRIPLLSLLILGSLGILFHISQRPGFELSDLLGLIPGSLFLILSIIKRDSIGKGDAYLVLILSLYYEIKFLYDLILLSFLLVYPVIFFLFIKSKKQNLTEKILKTEVPYVPFLFSSLCILTLSAFIKEYK